MKTNNILLNNFLLALKSDEKSQNTINSYETDIIQLLNYIRETRNIIASLDTFNKDFFNSVTYQDLGFYMNYLTANNIKASSRARKVASAKTFFNYLFDLEIISKNPALKLKSPTIPDRKPVYLDLEESKRLLSSVNKKSNHCRNKERDYAILTIFLNCGLRREEMVLINTEHIKGDILTVIGKGDKERDVVLTPACLSAIELYKSVRPQVDDKALFLSEMKERIDENTIYTLVKKYIGKAGLDMEKYSPHKLRHTSASLIYLYGEQDLEALRKMLGHTSIATTQIYTHIDKEQQRKVANSNPLSNIM